MPSDIKIAFGKRLKALIGRQGISLRELARRCGFGSGDIYRYCKAQRTPEIDGLYKIARHLGVSISELLPDSLVEDPLQGTSEPAAASNPDSVP